MAEPIRLGPELQAQAAASACLHRCPICGRADIAHETANGAAAVVGCAVHFLRWTAQTGELVG